MCFMFQSINALEVLHSVEGKCQVDNKSVSIRITSKMGGRRFKSEKAVNRGAVLLNCLRRHMLSKNQRRFGGTRRRQRKLIISRWLLDIVNDVGF